LPKRLTKRAFTLVLKRFRGLGLNKQGGKSRDFLPYSRFNTDDCLLNLWGEHHVRKLQTWHSYDLIRAQLRSEESICSQAVRLRIGNPALLGPEARCALLEAGEDDPEFAFIGHYIGGSQEIALAALWAMTKRLWSASPLGREKIEEPQHDLSLKHCLSFCALYQERNIRRGGSALLAITPAD